MPKDHSKTTKQSKDVESKDKKTKNDKDVESKDKKSKNDKDVVSKDKKTKNDKDVELKDKKSKKDNVDSVSKEKREFPTKESESIKSYVNTTTTKTWMKDFCDRFPLVRKKKKDETKEEKDEKDKIKPRIGITRSHCVMSAIDQLMIITLVNIAEQKTKKALADLYTITEEILIDVIRLNRDYNYVFGKYLDNYNSKENYSSQLKIDKKNFKNILNNLAFDGKSNVDVDKSGENFIMYIVLNNRIMLTETAFHMVQYAKKMCIDDKALSQAIKILYVGNMAKIFLKKVEDVMNVITEEKESKKDESSVDKKKDDKKKGSKKLKDKDTSDSSESSESELSESDKSESDSSSSESDSDSD
jgi:hypothetical protein